MMIERQPRHGDAKVGARARWIMTCITCLFSTAILAAIFSCTMVLLIYYNMPDKNYSVAIDSTSVLDHTTGISFNVTLGARGCIEPGMYVEVFYHGFQVAAGNTAKTRPTCARPQNMAELPVVVRATMAPVGDVLDSLAAELRQGAAVFDLRLHVRRSGKRGTVWLLWDCKGTRVGDAAVPCDSPKYTSRLARRSSYPD